MVSDYRAKKYLHVFNTFIDADKNGTIDKNDFVLAMGNVAKKRGYEPGDTAYKFMEHMLDLIWDGLSKAADTDSDGTIDKDEWVKLWGDMAQNPEPADWAKLFAKCIFQLIDAGNDGSITGEEYANFFDNFGISKDDALESFAKAAGGKDSITWDEFEVLIKEFIASDDEAAPGCFIFGKING